MTIYYLEQDTTPNPAPYQFNDIVVLIKADDKNQAWLKCGETLWRECAIPNASILEDHSLEHFHMGLTNSPDSIRTSGIVVVPSYVDNGDGSVTIGTGQYSLYASTDYLGPPKTFTVVGGTFTLTNYSANYIQVRYNDGSPIVEVISTVPPASTTDADKIPIFSLYRYDNDIHYFTWDHLALGLAEKLNQRFRRTDRFHVDSGLQLAETPTRIATISAGSVWVGANLIDLDAMTSTGTCHFYYHTAGAWTRSDVSQYNNTQYDDGTNLQTLASTSKYAVNWIYRGVHLNGAMYILVGSGNYSLAQAQASVEPVKPPEIITQSLLVGRIIIAKGSATPIQIDRVTDVTLGSSTVANHNDLLSIQGGTTDEYYHLSSADYIGSGTGLMIRQTNPVVFQSTVTKTGAYSIGASDYAIRCNGTTGAFAVTLPTAVGRAGQVYIIKKIDSSGNAITVNTTSSQTIDGALTNVLATQYAKVTVQSNGTNWDII